MTGNATRISVLMAATFLFSLALPSLVHGQTASFIARRDFIYDWGAVVTLTGNPAYGFRVAGWSGCDTVSGATCTVTISGAKSVIASFEPQGFVHRP